MNSGKNKEIILQFKNLCEREGVKAVDVLLWVMDNAVGAEQLPVTAGDMEDWLLYQQAKSEYDRNAVTFTHEEVKKLLEIDTDDVEEEALFYSPENIEHLKRAAVALDAGKGVEHDLVEVDDDIDCSNECGNI